MLIKIKTLFLSLICLVLSGGVSSQTSNKYYRGFNKKISGTSFGYHSPLPDVGRSLLIRGKANFEPIEWETEIVPNDHDTPSAEFIWMYGKDVTNNPSTFNLFFNGIHILKFRNSTHGKLGDEQVSGIDGSQLIFKNTMLDKYGDQMGFAILEVPINLVKKGTPNNIRIESNPEAQDTWYMTFEEPLQEEIEVSQNKVVIKEKGNLWHSALFEILHLGSDDNVTIEVENHRKNIDITTGYNRFEVSLPMVSTTTLYTAEITIGSSSTITKSFTLSPVKEWEIYLVQHTHSDIGYTRPQQEILPEHLRYIDEALDYCDATDHYPDAAKFRWTCETSWSVKEFLERRPKNQVDRLLARLQEGRIEATGMFFNFSEIIDESAVAYQTKYLRMLKNMGIDVKTAMQNDVNGAAWSLIDVFQHTGVKYLTMGLHGHRARKPFNQPTAFWWESPAENRLLAFRGEHYQHGNTLSLISGQQDVFCRNLTKYLTRLESDNYPYDKIALQFSGYVTDNSPPSTKVCEIIKEWNEKYEWPKLRSSLAKDFMIFLDEEHGEEIQSRQEAWPDWWTDGVGSATNETMQARNIHVEVASTSALLSMVKMQGIEIPKDIHNQIEAIYEDLLFYDEHTHGAAESVRDPLVLNSVNQWNMKSAYVWDALKRSSMLQEQALAYLEVNLPKYNKPSIAVFNTLNWKRNALVNIFIGKETIPEGKPFTITTSDNRRIPVEIEEQRVEGAYYNLWIEGLPPMGYKTLLINIGEKDSGIDPSPFSAFENQYYQINIDTSKGGIIELIDKELGIGITDSNGVYALGEVIHEQLKNRHDMERLTAALRDTVYRPLNQEYSTINNLQIIKTSDGPIYKSIHLHGEIPITIDQRGINIEIRLFHHEKKIELLYRMIKLPIFDPEGIYVSFPFYLPGGKLSFEVQGGIVTPGKNQLPGSASDWNTIQNFASVKNKDAQIVFVSNEIPLVQFGDLNVGRYYYQHNPKTNHIYSWVLNNYWVTNFKASQEGELRWTYTITSTDDISDNYAIKFGRDNRTPAIARLVSAGTVNNNSSSDEYSFLNIKIPNLLLVNCTPSLDDKGIILQLRETDGDHAIIDILKLQKDTKAISIQEVNVLEEVLVELNSPFLIEHFGTKFLKLNFE